jgi:HAE1 family hydrophobic/amphiphilic exporter-1
VEDELSTLAGIKTLRSINKEGLSVSVAEFTLETDVRYAEQQVRDRVSAIRRKLPSDSKEPVFRRIDPSDQPIIILSLTAELSEAQLFDLADQIVRPKIEQIDQVGLVYVIGGRKRELQVRLDRNKLKAHEISATQVAQRIAAAGQNIPAGKVDEGDKQTVLRSLAEFKNLKDIENTVVNFAGNEVPVRVKDLGVVVDGLEDENSRSFANGKKGVFLNVFRQSGANTIAVADSVLNRLKKLNEDMAKRPGHPKIELVRDGSKAIRDNVDDVNEAIRLGITLTLLVVFFFLGNLRSTLITGIAIPNSLIGAFFLMGLAGFTINMMTLLALSLAVGLLIDDAIVVRENIFRHMELGRPAREAASVGAKEVQLAVVATTLTVIAVFGPIGFLKGVVGQFFKQFGLSICFVMAISLFDALTMAPMLSANFGGGGHAGQGGWLWRNTIGIPLRAFDKFQDWLVAVYEKVLRFSLRFPILIIIGAIGVFIMSLVAAKFVPKTFLPPQDYGDFSVSRELPPGANLEATQKVAFEVDKIIRANREVDTSTLILGNQDAEQNIAQFFVKLIPSKQRKGVNTSDVKEKIRGQLKPLAWASPVVKDFDAIGGGQRPFNVLFVGDDLKVLEDYTGKVFEKLKNHPAFKDAELSYKPGKPEFQVVWDNQRGQILGVSSAALGLELRTQVEGVTPAVFRENGREYDIRVRLQENQRNIRQDFNNIFVPNVNMSLIRLQNVAHPVSTTGPSTITRQERGRAVQVGADMAPGGPGMGEVIQDIAKLTSSSGEFPLPPGVRYLYVGQAENFKELVENMVVAVLLSILFIYLVLASLYESFITPFTIMLVLPLAICGAFYALFITHQSLDIFSMIGCVMLLGIATKNSILLVDYTNHLMSQGWQRADAIIEAGKVRLRPILMTSVALIAGMLPVAIGLNEASKQRVSMGIAIIGGLISSTLLTLVVVPAAFSYIDRFKNWIGKWFVRLTRPTVPAGGAAHGESHTPAKRREERQEGYEADLNPQV